MGPTEMVSAARYNQVATNKNNTCVRPIMNVSDVAEVEPHHADSADISTFVLFYI